MTRPRAPFEETQLRFEVAIPARGPAEHRNLAAILSRFEVAVIDGRPKSDPLYVLADDSNPDLSKALRALGFNYNKIAKKWWTRDQSIL